MTDDPSVSVAPVIIRAFPDPDEPEMMEFFYWLGSCITRWAYVDRQLYFICRFALQLDDRRTSLFYYRDRNFESRLRFVAESLKAIVDSDPFTNEWKPLQARITTLSATRNIIAHHPVMRYGYANDGKPCYEYSIRIEPYERLLGREYPGLLEKDSVGIDDLKNHAYSVEDAYKELNKFLKRALMGFKGGL